MPVSGTLLLIEMWPGEDFDRKSIKVSMTGAVNCGLTWDSQQPWVCWDSKEAPLPPPHSLSGTARQNLTQGTKNSVRSVKVVQMF